MKKLLVFFTGVETADGSSNGVNVDKSRNQPSNTRRALFRRMAKKIFATIAICTIVGSVANGQAVEVLSNGNVGIGESNPTHRLHVKGNSAFDGNVGIGKPSSTYKLDVNGDSRFGSIILGTYKPDCRFAPSYPAVYSTDFLLLGTPSKWVYTTFSSNVYYYWSGTVAKKPINLCSQPVLPRIDVIGTYEVKWTGGISIVRGSAEEPMEYVFDPEELKAVFPALVSVYDTCDDGEPKYAINYAGMTPILTAAINEQQKVITTQQETIDQHQERIDQQQAEIGILQQVAFGQELDLTELHELRARVNVLDEKVNMMQRTIDELRNVILVCCDKTVDALRQQDSTLLGNDNHKNNNNNSNTQTLTPDEAILYQNTPNPFSSNTEISCYVPAITNNAFIYVYNLQGTELMSFPILQSGFSTVTIYASALPAGMYLYTLVVDNVIIDSKRMILTK